MRRAYKRGLTTTSGGNISLKVSDDIILITPSGTDKGRMKWHDVGIVTLGGINMTPALKPSMEAEMHLSVYRKNNEITAVIHAHPVYASSFTALKCSIDTSLTAEATAILGNPLMVPYALMGTPELAGAVSEYSLRSGILLLENHGIVTTGNSLIQAFDRLEILENAAMMTFITEIMKKKRPLGKTRRNEIENMFK